MVTPDDLHECEYCNSKEAEFAYDVYNTRLGRKIMTKVFICPVDLQLLALGWHGEHLIAQPHLELL